MKDDPQNNVLEQNGNFHFANIRANFECISSLHAPKEDPNLNLKLFFPLFSA